MTTSEIIKILARRLGITQVAARAVVHRKLETLTHQIYEEGGVALKGFGKITVQTAKARRNYIPGKSKYYLIPAHKRVKFSAYPSFKNRLKEEGAEQ
ncbi:MAG: HU family DNA-binding protein [Gammaproteobacteria bacterium]|jgi:nucleoid DNA-binding protein